MDALRGAWLLVLGNALPGGKVGAARGVVEEKNVGCNSEAYGHCTEQHSVGWVERSETHLHHSTLDDGFRWRSTHPTKCGKSFPSTWRWLNLTT